MRKLTTIGICVLLALLAAAAAWYAHDRRGGAMLRQAEALMGTNPDSARQVLEQYAPARHLRGEHQARYALLLTQARFKTYQPTDNDSLIRIAVDYYAHSSDSLRKAWSCFYAGRTYANRQEKSRALRCYQQAASAATNTSDYKFQSLLYFYWGSILQSQYPHTEGLEKFEESLRFDWLREDTLGAVATLEEIAWSHAYNTDFNQSVDCLQKALSYTHANDTSTLEDIYQRFGIILHLGGRYNEALRYINLSLQYTSADPRFQTTKLFTKGIILNSLEQYDSVSYYISQRKWENHYDRANYQREMARLKNGQGKYAEAYQWMSQYSESKDSIYHHENQYSLVQLQKLYDYSRVENENMRLKAEKQSLLLAFLIPVTIALAAMFACIVMYRLLQKMKRWSFLQKEKTARQHEMKYANLQALLTEYSKREMDLQESISHSKKQMEHYVRQQKYIKEKYLADCDVRPLLKQRIARMEEGKGTKASERILSADELARLLITTDALFGNFASRLQLSYGLSDTDLHLCCLLKLGVKSSHIGLLLNASNEALKKRASRLCKNKFNTDLRLEEFIASFH
ncbi:MAG: hypothetical protein ACI36X_06590 [Bacteroidaceae bacterium]